jgi:hypothetical protein
MRRIYEDVSIVRMRVQQPEASTAADGLCVMSIFFHRSLLTCAGVKTFACVRHIFRKQIFVEAFIRPSARVYR